MPQSEHAPASSAEAHSTAQRHGNTGFLDFQAIKQAVTPQTVLSALNISYKTNGNELVFRNPKRADQRAGSMSINKTTGKWKDFAMDDARGSDVIALVAYVRGCSDKEAAQWLTDYFHIHSPVTSVAAVTTNENTRLAPDRNDGRRNRTDANEVLLRVTPVPDDAPPPPAVHPRFGSPDSKYEYRSGDGQLLCLVYRFDKPPQCDRKQFPTLMYTDGRWRWKMPSCRPLYNLDRITSRRDYPVVICEGEKAANAAGRLLPSCVATTSMGGALAADKTDWSPLTGRECWIWRDNDENGRKYAEAVKRLVTECGGTVKLINIAATVPPGRELMPKCDAADVETMGVTANDFTAMITSGDFFETDESNSQSKSVCRNIPPGFDLRADGVYWFDDEGKALRLCGYLKVMATTSNAANLDWGRLLEFKDPLGNLKQFCMPMEMLKDSGSEYRGALLNMGLEISQNRRARDMLSLYIQQSQPQTHATCVNRTGWFGNHFVLPNQTLGSAKSKPVFQSDDPFEIGLAQSGTLADWKREIAARCAGNSRLVFAVSVMLASPLLSVLGAEGSGFNFRGQSSTGKTTALRVAASVFGGRDFVKTWRSTTNGLEAVACRHSDIGLILDELAEVDPRDAGSIAYMLVNGHSKQRATKYGGARSTSRWTLNFLSSGEIGLAEHQQSVGMRTTAGQEVRILDIPADAGSGMGLFNTLHGMPDAQALAQELASASDRNHGVAGLTYLNCLVSERASLITKVAAYSDTFGLMLKLAPNVDGQVKRVARKFGLVAAGGELATDFGITDWQPGEVLKAAHALFEDWLMNRGSDGSAEAAKLLDQVRLYLERYGESRFSPLGHDAVVRTVNDRVGFSELNADNERDYFVFSKAFDAELCKGFDHRFAVRTLIQSGCLNPGLNGRTTIQKRIPGLGNYWFYHLSSQALK